MLTMNCNSLLLLVVVAMTLAISQGFSSVGSASRSPKVTALNVAAEANDFASTMPEKVDPHITIGVEQEKLAIGINATEFLEWVGTREDLITKIESDFNKFDRKKAEEEADKFMMDAENVNMYIRYLKDKEENPGKYAQQALEEELSLSNPKTLATYGAWLAGGLGFGALRKEFIDPKFESGEWAPIKLEWPFSPPAGEAVDAASTLTSKATDMIVDGISNGLDSTDYFV